MTLRHSALSYLATTIVEGDVFTPARMLDTALEAAGMGAWRYTFADHVCYCSPRAQELYGLSAPYFVRDDEAVRHLVHPDDTAIVSAAVRAACDPSGDGRYIAEYRVRRLGGGWRWLSVWGLAEFEGEGPDRRAVAMSGASRDITDRKHAEMFSEAQKQSLELVVSGAPLADVLAYLTRVVEEQSEGQSVAAILFLDDEGRLRNGASPSLPAEYVAAIDGLTADPYVGTCSAAAATGAVVVTTDIASDPAWAAIRHLPLDLGLVAAWSKPIVARDGRVLGTFGTYFRTCRGPSAAERDAVEILSRTAALAIERARVDDALRASEQRMRADDRRKDEFLAALSHELRNPLAPLRTAVQLLRNTPTEQARERLVQTMERQVDQMVRLVDDLLEVSRISRGSLQLRHELLPLADVVAVAIETSQPLVEAGGHTLAVDTGTGPVWVQGDRVRLAQVLSNLLNNAAKYTDPGGRIELRVRTEGSQVRVSVRDNGVGMDPAAIPRLFELFARGPESPERNRDGLGVGLALALRLAEMHNGSVTGTSAGIGHGAEFTLHLPLALPAVSAAAGDLAPPADVQSRARVLIVDDNVDAAEMTVELLKTMGCEAEGVFSGAAALDAAATMRPDVILLDIGLPDVSGYDVCRRLRDEPWGASTTIVALTGWGQDRDRVASEAAGFDAHFVKPVDFDALAALLRSVDGGRRP